MRDKTIVVSAILASLMLSMTVLSVSAWVYAPSQGIADDSKFEPWGPRIDELELKIYGDDNAMFTALKAGEIDFAGSSIPNTYWLNQFVSDPNIVVRGYGGESGYYEINLNQNNNPYLGNPPDSNYPNPVYPNPCSVLEFRQACAHLINRAYLSSVVGEGFYDSIYTPVPAYMVGWRHPDIQPNGALENLTYPTSIADAAALLDASGFPLGDPTNGGKRYWDRNRNGVYDAGESFKLKLYTRSDPFRLGAADMLAASFDNPAIQIPYDHFIVTGSEAYEIVFMNKDYNIYFARWFYVGPEPDYLRDLYHSDFYFHPGDPPNFGFLNDQQLDSILDGMKNAPDIRTLLDYAIQMQERFSEIVGSIPLASRSQPKAFFRYYTGGNNMVMVEPDDGENQYRGREWTHVVNQKGFGANSWGTTQNAYPAGHPFGDGSMTMRIGILDIGVLNPIYTQGWVAQVAEMQQWDWEVLGRMYDSMAGRNPYTAGPFEVDSLAHEWEIGTYVDSEDGQTKSVVTVHLRSDVQWSDGNQFDADDLIYTLTTLPAELEAKGAPLPPRWEYLAGFGSDFWKCTKIDQFTVEIKLPVLSATPELYMLSYPILPQHLLSPFLTNPATTVAEIEGSWWPWHIELLTGTGPFKIGMIYPEKIIMLRNQNYFARSHPADLNYDRIVDIFDIVTIAVPFGSVPGDPTWNPKADINKDGIVDIFDLAYVALNFGWSG